MTKELVDVWLRTALLADLEPPARPLVGTGHPVRMEVLCWGRRAVRVPLTVAAPEATRFRRAERLLWIARRVVPPVAVAVSGIFVALVLIGVFGGVVWLFLVASALALVEVAAVAALSVAMLILIPSSYPQMFTTDVIQLRYVNAEAAHEWRAASPSAVSGPSCAFHCSRPAIDE